MTLAQDLLVLFMEYPKIVHLPGGWLYEKRYGFGSVTLHDPETLCGVRGGWAGSNGFVGYGSLSHCVELQEYEMCATCAVSWVLR